VTFPDTLTTPVDSVTDELVTQGLLVVAVLPNVDASALKLETTWAAQRAVV
jgi:hypothetical protein